jgi:hypothetical protein
VYEKYEMLWNAESDKWIIATEMREKNYLRKSTLKGLTADCVRKKIKIMKTVYSQELKKLMKLKKSGAGTNDFYKLKLPWSDICR